MRNFLASSKFIWFLIGVVFIIHLLAQIYFWYWKFEWLDTVLHFLGGFTVAAVFFNLAARWPEQSGFVKNFLPMLILALSFTAFVGVMWEFFEFSFDRIFSVQNTLWQAQLGLEDTITDLWMDLLGGAALIFLYWRKSQ